MIRLTVDSLPELNLTVEEMRIIEAVSPVVSLERTEEGALLIVKDVNGTHQALIYDGQKGDPGIKGDPGNDGYSPVVSVQDIEGGHRITIEDGTGQHSFDVMNGDTGTGIVSIQKTGTAGLVDTYTITLSNGQTATFTVTNGQDGQTPTVPVQDVQVNGTSVVNNGVASVPLAGNNVYGVSRLNDYFGISITPPGQDGGILRIFRAPLGEIKDGTAYYRPIVPEYQHASTFYGLAKVAGADMKNSTNPVGTYTDEAKIAIQKMLGVYEAPWELIREDTVTNATKANIDITVDNNGQPFELTDLRLMITFPSQETEVKVESYGRVKCYYGTNAYDILYIGAMTQAAGSSASGTRVWIEQHNGMIERYYTTISSSGNSLSVMTNNAIAPGDISHWRLVNTIISYTKVSIEAVTGTCKYYLFGKRRWN